MWKDLTIYQRSLLPGCHQLIKFIILEKLLLQYRGGIVLIQKIIEEMLEEIIPSLQIKQYLYDFSNPAGVSLFINNNDYTKGVFGYVQKVHKLVSDNIFHRIAEIFSKSQESYTRFYIQPSILPVTLLNIKYYHRYGLLKGIPTEDNQYILYPAYNMFIMKFVLHFLYDKIIPLAAMSYYISNTTVSPESHFPDIIFTNASRHPEYKKAQIFTDLSLGWADAQHPENVNWCFMQNVSMITFLGHAFDTNLKDNDGKQTIYTSFKEKVSQYFSKIGLTPHEINTIFGTYYKYKIKIIKHTRYLNEWLSKTFAIMHKYKHIIQQDKTLNNIIHHTIEEVKELTFRNDYERKLADMVFEPDFRIKDLIAQVRADASSSNLDDWRAAREILEKIDYPTTKISGPNHRIPFTDQIEPEPKAIGISS